LELGTFARTKGGYSVLYLLEINLLYLPNPKLPAKTTHKFTIKYYVCQSAPFISGFSSLDWFTVFLRYLNIAFARN
jgi:hypothetical protein